MTDEQESTRRKRPQITINKMDIENLLEINDELDQERLNSDDHKRRTKLLDWMRTLVKIAVGMD